MRSLEDEFDAALALLDDLTEDGPCRLDHNQDCQAHNAFGEDVCPVRRSQILLARNGIRSSVPSAPQRDVGSAELPLCDEPFTAVIAHLGVVEDGRVLLPSEHAADLLTDWTPQPVELCAELPDGERISGGLVTTLDVVNDALVARGVVSSPRLAGYLGRARTDDDPPGVPLFWCRVMVLGGRARELDPSVRLPHAGPAPRRPVTEHAGWTLGRVLAVPSSLDSAAPLTRVCLTDRCQQDHLH